MLWSTGEQQSLPNNSCLFFIKQFFSFFLPVSSSQSVPPSQFLPVSSSQLVPPSQFLPVSSSQSVPPSQFLPVSSSQLVPPSQFLPVSSSQSVPPSQFLPVSSSQSVPPSQFRPVSSPQSVPPSQFRPVSSSQSVPPSQFLPVSSAQSVPPSQFLPVSSSQLVLWFLYIIAEQRTTSVSYRVSMALQTLFITCLLLLYTTCNNTCQVVLLMLTVPMYTVLSTTQILVKLFKHRRRVNTAMPANTAMPMFLAVVRQKCTYGNMAESKLP